MAEQDEPKPKREPGSPSAFSDFRGGPANFGRLDFQVRYAVLRMVDWLQEHWGDSTGTGAVRCEPRLVHLPAGDGRAMQHGFDVAVAGRNGPVDEYLEAKRTPVYEADVDRGGRVGRARDGVGRRRRATWRRDDPFPRPGEAGRCRAESGITTNGAYDGLVALLGQVFGG
jgi:hypothetical protein